MNRAHLIRLNPTKAQVVYFRKACGVARHAYNWALARWKEEHAKGKRVTIRQLKAEYNRIKREQFPWVYEVTKCAPEHEFDNLSQAFANYWRMKAEGTQPTLKHPRKDGEKAGFPHFKSKRRDKCSFYLNNDKFYMDDSWLYVPKLGKVNLTEQLRLAGKIVSATIIEQAGGYVQLVDRWYASSKTCYHCGWVKDDLTLADRVWTCEQCGRRIERDLNAARNVKAETFRLVTEVPVVASSGPKFACGAGRAGLLTTVGETFCMEAGTTMSDDDV